MKCRVARAWLRRRLDAPLEAETERTLQAHLESCAPCAAEGRDVEQLRTWLADLPLAEPSENFDWRLRLRLSKAEREAMPPLLEPRVRHVWSGLEFWSAAAAAAVVVVTVGLHLLRTPADESASGERTPKVLVRNSPGALEDGSEIRPVRDGLPGPQQPLPYRYMFFMQEPGPPAPPPDTLPASAPAAR